MTRRAADGRELLLAELAAYVASDSHERAMVTQLRTFVAAHEDCFERSSASGHVTGSAWIVDRLGTAAILAHHRKLGRWLQLGGHADGEADIRAVALREATEESGLRDIAFATHEMYDIDVHEIPAHGSELAHLHYDVRFAFFARRGDVPHASAESHAVAWIPLCDLARYGVDDSVRRLAAKTPRLSGALQRAAAAIVDKHVPQDDECDERAETVTEQTLQRRNE